MPRKKNPVTASLDLQAEEAYWQENFASRPYAAGAAYEHYAPAYRYGWALSDKHEGKPFDEIAPAAGKGWGRARSGSPLTWEQAHAAARDAYDRVIRLYEERLRVSKEEVQTGEVRVSKEVTTEMQTLTVPVEREEVVIERHAVNRPAEGAAFGAENIRVPVREEQVTVEKEAVLKEEVRVGKRQVHDTERVSGTVRTEHLKVEGDGDTEVREIGPAADRT